MSEIGYDYDYKSSQYVYSSNIDLWNSFFMFSW